MAAAETGRERGGREAAQPVHRSFGRRRGRADSGRVQDVGAPVRTYEKGGQKPSCCFRYRYVEEILSAH
jgi:hypothetical protein